MNHLPVSLPQSVLRVISDLQLTPHPREGGFFFETYRNHETVNVDGRKRSLATAIYFLVLAGSPTELHRLPGDELFHFYMGEPVELFLYDERNGPRRKNLGVSLEKGMRPQVLIPGGVWQAARVNTPGGFSLLGTTMSPGFDYADYQACSHEEWVSRYPDAREAMENFFSAL